MAQITHEEVDAIFSHTAAGRALLPFLRDFKGEDILVYQQVGTALFRAYELGLETTMRVFKKAVEMEAPKHEPHP